jgi:hypothetical protein
MRHGVNSFWKRWDQEYAEYCREWLEAILPLFVEHQITHDPENGCIIALQIENELFETIGGVLPIGLADDMKHLSMIARTLGMTVPLFTNDGFEAGSFNPKSSKFGLDLYGFDKYVIFVPASSIEGIVFGSNKSDHDADVNWNDWRTSTFMSAIDGLEKRVRGFGGGASETPIFIPELQGGWFNHYSVGYTYDKV